MGGSGGGKKKQQAPAPASQDNSGAIIAMMQQQQAAAAEAQRQAVLESQRQAAHQQAAQGEALAQQSLMTGEALQKMKDQTAVQEYSKTAQAAGSAVTGGGYDINAANQAKLTNLGAASPMLPQTMANAAGSTLPTENPALARQPNKQFNMPSMSGIQFGGS